MNTPVNPSAPTNNPAAPEFTLIEGGSGGSSWSESLGFSRPQVTRKEPLLSDSDLVDIREAKGFKPREASNARIAKDSLFGAVLGGTVGIVGGPAGMAGGAAIGVMLQNYFKMRSDEGADARLDQALDNAAKWGAKQGGVLTPEQIERFKNKYAGMLSANNGGGAAALGIGGGILGFGSGFMKGMYDGFKEDGKWGIFTSVPRALWTACKWAAAGATGGGVVGWVNNKLSEGGDNKMKKFEESLEYAAKKGHEIAVKKGMVTGQASSAQEQQQSTPEVAQSQQQAASPTQQAPAVNNAPSQDMEKLKQILADAGIEGLSAINLDEKKLLKAQVEVLKKDNSGMSQIKAAVLDNIANGNLDVAAGMAANLKANGEAFYKERSAVDPKVASVEAAPAAKSEPNPTEAEVNAAIDSAKKDMGGVTNPNDIKGGRGTPLTNEQRASMEAKLAAICSEIKLTGNGEVKVPVGGPAKPVSRETVAVRT